MHLLYEIKVGENYNFDLKPYIILPLLDLVKLNIIFNLFQLVPF